MFETYSIGHTPSSLEHYLVSTNLCSFVVCRQLRELCRRQLRRAWSSVNGKKQNNVTRRGSFSEFFCFNLGERVSTYSTTMGFKLTVFSVTDSQNACMEQKILPVSAEFLCVECIGSRLLTLCPLLWSYRYLNSDGQYIGNIGDRQNVRRSLEWMCGGLAGGGRVRPVELRRMGVAWHSICR